MPSPKLTTPKQAKQQTISNFNRTWTNRVDVLSGVQGLNMMKHVVPVWKNDKDRVLKGMQPYSDAQVMAFVAGLKQGKSPVSNTDTGHHGLLGIIGNAGGDIGKVAASLNPRTLVPGLIKGGYGLESIGSRFLGDVVTPDNNPGNRNAATKFLDKILGAVEPGYKDVAKETNRIISHFNKRHTWKDPNLGTLAGDIGEGLHTLPGAQVVPGAYTLGNILQGKPEEAIKHPIFTGLDVLPFASDVGEAAAGYKFGEAAADVKKATAEGIIPKGSVWEALADGKPLKALTRKTGLTAGDASSLPGFGSAATEAARKAGVSSDIREASGAQAQSLREGAVNEKFLGARDFFMNDLKRRFARLEDIKYRIKQAEKNPGWQVTKIMRHELKWAERKYQQASEEAARVTSADWIHWLWKNQSKTKEEIVSELEARGYDPSQINDYLGETENVRGQMINLYEYAGRWKVTDKFKRLITNEDPKNPFGGDPQVLKNYYIPRYLAEAMEKVRRPTRGDFPTRAYRTGTNVFRTAVLMGPRHSAHVLFSNALFMALQDMGNFKPEIIMKAWRALHDPESWPRPLAKGSTVWSTDVKEEVRTMGVEDYEKAGVLPEHIHSIQEGKTIARVFKEWLAHSKIANSILAPVNPLAYRRFDEFLTDMSRAMTYFRGREKYFAADKGYLEARAAAKDAIGRARRELAPGEKTSMNLGKAEKAGERATTQALQEAEGGAHEAGLQTAIRVLMDIDHMSPFERTTMRYVFPFYAFTRHLLKYMMEYPADHPMRAAVLAAVGRMEMEDQNSGLPMQFMSLFPITGADKNGDALFIDTKNMNPFRTMNGLDPWTRAGFLSSLNPLITIPISASGFNVLNATPELFPTLTVDPVTGDLVSKPKQPFAQTAAEKIIPEFQSVEAMFGWSDNLAQLHKNDPEAYRRAILNSLNIPLSPGARNIAKERIRYSRNQYTVAEQNVTDAIKNKDWGALSGYEYVPYHGRLWTPKQLKRALNG